MPSQNRSQFIDACAPYERSDFFRRHSIVNAAGIIIILSRNDGFFGSLNHKSAFYAIQFLMRDN